MRGQSVIWRSWACKVPADTVSSYQSALGFHALRGDAMGMNRQLTAVLGLVLSLAFADSSAHAGSQSWVSGVGSDGNPCTRTAPCLTFAGALVKTAAGGEIDCLDPGSYGAVTITKAVTLDCSATFGLVEVSGTNGINVSAGASDIVIIRGLSFRGGVNGIDFTSGAQLSVERCLIKGFSQNGIQINMSSGGSVYVTNTYITGVSNGIVAQTSAGALTVAVNQSTIANPTANGFQAASGTIDATITNTLILKAGTNSVVGSGGKPPDQRRLVNGGR
jgi:Right handed beta helix region